jgi:hypothetical protein
MALFDRMIPKTVPVISPAFKWAQSGNSTFLEIKYSTRLDSPFACAELYDEERKILGEGTILYITAMCAKTDQSLLKYELNLTLSEKVEEEPLSYFGDLSNGKFFVNLTKVERPVKWKRLIAED